MNVNRFTLESPLRYGVNIRPVDVAELYKHPDTSKPVERRRRKAMDLKLHRSLVRHDSQVAEGQISSVPLSVLACLSPLAWHFFISPALLARPKTIRSIWGWF